MLVHLAIADSTNDQYGYELWMRQHRLAAKARVSRRVVTDALAWLCDQGLLELMESGKKKGSANRYRLLMPALPVVFDARQGTQPVPTPIEPTAEEGTQPVPTGVGEECLQNPRDNPKGEPKVDGLADARTLVERVWERSDPKPATPFIAAVKIAKALLDAGHERNAIGRAMLTAPTISTRTLEIELAKARPPAPRQAMMEDRDGPEGRIPL